MKSIRTRLTAAAVAVLLLTGAAGCSKIKLPGGKPDSGSKTAAPSAHDYTPDAAKIVAKLTTEQKVGQLFMVRRSAVSDQLLASGKVGGVIFFAADGDLKGSSSDIAERAGALQKKAVAGGAKLPLLVTTDQEHGSFVNRLSDSQATVFPGNMALGATGKPELAEAAGKTSGAELRSLGFNLDLAPDADVNYNVLNPIIGERSFGDDPGAVAALTAAAVKGYQSSNVATAVKHFPGHGGASTDSHNGLPVISGSAADFKKKNLPPFTSAIKAGADVVMVGHLMVPSLDGDHQATLSHKIMTDLLRGELGFTGVTITDSLEMGGITTSLSPAEIPVRAFLAGSDILLMPKDLDVAYNSVLKAVSDKKITAKALDASVTRIVALKLKLGLSAGKAPVSDGKAAKSDQAKSVCNQIGTQALTLIDGKNGQQLVGEHDKVYVRGADDDAIKALRQALPEANRSDTLEGSQVVVVTVTSPTTVQLDRLTASAADGRRVIALLTGTPYSGAYTTAAPVTIASYSATACSMRAVATALTEKHTYTGKLPVNVPDGSGDIKYKRGFSQ